MAKEAAAILAKRKTSRKPNDAEVKVYSAGCVANKDDEEYVSRAAAVLPVHASPSTKLISPSSIVIYHGHLSPTQITSKKYNTSVACSVILDQKFVPGTIIDSAAMMNVVENTSRQEVAGGKRVNILGVTGDTTSAQVADVVFSIKTKVKKPYVLATKGTTLVLDKTKDNILSLTVLLQSGFKVDFAIDTVDDPNFGGVLTTPTGARATLLFENNLWRIPMAFLATMTASTSQAHISDEHNIQASPITIPEISSKIAASADRQATCVSKDGKTASTIRNVIAVLQHNDTNAAVPMGLVMQRLQSTDIQDYIERSYGSLLHFVQESSYTSHFQITSGSHGDFITCTQKETPIRVNPVDVSPVDGPTADHMHLNIHKWGFPSRNLMIKCHDKYKNQVAFPPNFVRNAHRYRDPTAAVSLGAHVRTALYRSVKKAATSPSNGLHID
jgi:hypothetical protein